MVYKNSDHININSNNRIYYLDVLKCLAMIAVIVLHVAAGSFYGVGIETKEW